MTETPRERPRAKFVVLSGAAAGQVCPVAGDGYVGRSPDCAVCLDLPSVSRHHASISERGGKYIINDENSRNGIRVNGQPVRESPLANGDVVIIGDVEMRFEQDASAAAPRKLTGRDILAVAQSGAVPPGGFPAGGLPPPGSAAAEQPARLGLNLKLIIVIIVALLLSIIAGALLLHLLRKGAGVRTAELPPSLIQVGENRWRKITGLPIKPEGAKNPIPVGEWSSVEVEDPTVASVDRYEEGDIVIRGLNGGDTWVTIQMASGSILRFLVMVRGRVENHIDLLTYGDYSPEQRTSMARRFYLSGRAIEAEKPYMALQQYDMGVALLKPMRDKGSLYIDLMERQRAVSELVRERWDELSKDIKLAIKNNDSTRAVQLCEQALMLIPDPNDPRHQQARYQINVTMRRALRAKREE